MATGPINPGFPQPTYSLAGQIPRGGSAGFVRAQRTATANIVPDLGELILLKIDPYYEYAKLWRSPLGSTLRFTFLDLDQGIAENAAVNYADIEILGRTELFKMFTGTQNREVSLTFQFRAQGQSGGTLSDIIDREVMQPAKFLDALKFPLIGDDEVSHAPPPCILTIGRLLLIRVVVTEAQITWVPPFDPETMLPYGADVSVTFTAVHRGMSNYNFNGPRRFQTGSLFDAADDSPAIDLNSIGAGGSGSGSVAV